MEKNCNRCPKDACSKLHRAVTSCPVAQTIRRIPWSRSSTPTSPSVKVIDIQSKLESPSQPESAEGGKLKAPTSKGEAAVVIPISFDYSSQQAASLLVPTQKSPQVAKVSSMVETEDTAANTKANYKVESPQVHHGEGGKKIGVHIEDMFTDFINRARIKMRTKSNVGDGTNESEGHDKFTEFIDRSKRKIRTTSSIAPGKHGSFK